MSEAQSVELTVGQPAPDFELASDQGQSVRLSALRGRPVVLYFYPKDNTPGCTTQACDFRDHGAQIQSQMHAQILGVSRDSLASHARFREKHTLDFPLLSDPDGEVHAAYGALGKKLLFGKWVQGVIRKTVLIDAQGKISRVWPKVRVKGHAVEVLEALRALTAEEASAE